MGHAATLVGAGYDYTDALGAGARRMSDQTCIRVYGVAGCLAAGGAVRSARSLLLLRARAGRVSAGGNPDHHGAAQPEHTGRPGRRVQRRRAGVPGLPQAVTHRVGSYRTSGTPALVDGRQIRSNPSSPPLASQLPSAANTSAVTAAACASMLAKLSPSGVL